MKESYAVRPSQSPRPRVTHNVWGTSIEQEVTETTEHAEPEADIDLCSLCFLLFQTVPVRNGLGQRSWWTLFGVSRAAWFWRILERTAGLNYTSPGRQ